MTFSINSIMSHNVFGSSTELSAIGAKRNVEDTPKPYPGPTIPCRPCWPHAEQISENDKVDKSDYLVIKLTSRTRFPSLSRPAPISYSTVAVTVSWY